MDILHCTHCGAYLFGSGRFCGVCGKKVERPLDVFRKAEKVARLAFLSAHEGASIGLVNAAQWCWTAAYSKYGRHLLTLQVNDYVPQEAYADLALVEQKAHELFELVKDF